LSILQEREETDQTYTFLAALDSSYEATRTQILLSTDKLSFDEVTACIKQEATRRVTMGTSDPNPKFEALAFSARHLAGDSKAKGKGSLRSALIAKGRVTTEKGVGH
jgi:hypothetical protein